MGFPPNMFFDWKTWIDEGLADGITFRTSWFEAWEDPPEGKANRQRLTRSLSDPVAEEALTYATRAGVPLYLNRYIARAVGNDEYVADLEAVYNDDRFARLRPLRMGQPGPVESGRHPAQTGRRRHRANPH